MYVTVFCKGENEEIDVKRQKFEITEVSKPTDLDETDFRIALSVPFTRYDIKDPLVFSPNVIEPTNNDFEVELTAELDDGRFKTPIGRNIDLTPIDKFSHVYYRSKKTPYSIILTLTVDGYVIQSRNLPISIKPPQESDQVKEGAFANPVVKLMQDESEVQTKEGEFQIKDEYPIEGSVYFEN